MTVSEVGLTWATGKLAKGQASKTFSEPSRFERIGNGTYRPIAEPAPDAGGPLMVMSEA